jgi:NADH-quinone oxidoreductase subunit L
MMTIGTLALTGFFFTAGYYSKDAILEAAFASGTAHGLFAFFVGATVALLTSFYSWRLVFLTFFGQPRWAASEHIQHAVHDAHHGDHHHGHHDGTHDGTAGYHPHESPLSMLIPLFVLGGGALFAGIIWHGAFVEAETGAAFWRGSLAFDTHLMHALHEVPAWVVWTPSIAFFAGLGLAWHAYVNKPSIPVWWRNEVPGLYDFLLRKWYFDELYNAIFVKPALWFGRIFWTRGDQQTIDRFGPNGAAEVVVAGAATLRRFQSGYLYSYALVMLVGLAAAAAWMMR